MARPVCRQHPDGRVRRDGYYGKHREFARWECVPGVGEPPHYLRRDQLSNLRAKLVGGLHGSCDECEWRWGPTDGLVSAHYDNFVLRAKAQALVSIAQGSLSLRGAAHEVRVATIERRTGRRPAAYSVSRDGRLARDWVPQYTDISAEHYLPTHWPKLITVDSFDVRLSDTQGRPSPEGQAPLLGHRCRRLRPRQPSRPALARRRVRRRERDRVQRVRPPARRPARRPAGDCRLRWLVGHPQRGRVGVPENGGVHVRLAPLQPAARACAPRRALHQPGRRIYRVLREDMFWYPARWDQFERVFARYRNADLSRVDEKTIKGIESVVKWRRRNRDAINRLLPQTHWPRDLKHLEERLDTIQSRLGDRRRSFRNLHRLTPLRSWVISAPSSSKPNRA